MKRLAVALALILATLLGGEALAYTCPANSKNPGQTVKTPAQCNLPGGNGSEVVTTTNNMINFIIGALGLIAVVMIVIGGVGYTTSAGDAAKVKRAKDMILYAIIGLVVAMLAFAIVNFILSGIFKSGSSTPNNPNTQPATATPTNPEDAGSKRKPNETDVEYKKRLKDEKIKKMKEDFRKNMEEAQKRFGEDNNRKREELSKIVDQEERMRKDKELEEEIKRQYGWLDEQAKKHEQELYRIEKE